MDVLAIIHKQIRKQSTNKSGPNKAEIDSTEIIFGIRMRMRSRMQIRMCTRTRSSLRRRLRARIRFYVRVCPRSLFVLGSRKSYSRSYSQTRNRVRTAPHTRFNDLRLCAQTWTRERLQYLGKGSGGPLKRIPAWKILVSTYSCIFRQPVHIGPTRNANTARPRTI